jgi:hypothetical protein
MSRRTHQIRRGAAVAALAAAATVAVAPTGAMAASHKPSKAHAEHHRKPAHRPAKPAPPATPATVQLLTPRSGDHTGNGSKGWFVDVKANFSRPLAATGFSAEQLTGPAVHANVPPFPGGFGPGQDDRLPGLIVIDSTTQTTLPDGTPTGLAGPGQNLANLFNVTGETNRTATSTQISDTWIVGGPNFGHNTPSTIWVAVAADKNGDGVFNDAPATVPDENRDGRIDAQDLVAYGVASNVAAAQFTIVD